MSMDSKVTRFARLFIVVLTSLLALQALIWFFQDFCGHFNWPRTGTVTQENMKNGGICSSARFGWHPQVRGY